MDNKTLFIYSVLIHLLIYTTSSFSQTPGEQFCFCKLNGEGRTEGSMAFGMRTNFVFNSQVPRDDYASANIIWDLPIDTGWGFFISGELVAWQNESTRSSKVQQFANPSAGINISGSFYKLIKLGDFEGMYIYPQFNLKANDMLNTIDSGYVRYYSYGFALNSELMLKKVPLIYPVVISLRGSYTHFSETKSRYIIGTKKNNARELSLNISYNFLRTAVAAFANSISVMFVNGASPFYTTSIMLLIPRLDLVAKIF